MFSVREASVAALVLAAPSASALAGVTYHSTFGSTTQYGGSFVAGSSSTGDYTLTPSSLTATLRGDSSYVLPYQTNSPGRWKTNMLTLFTVGLIPVEVTSLDYSMNFKLVMGNGDAFSPRASVITDYYIQQALDPFNPNPDTDPIYFGNGRAYYQEGNGYNVVDESYPAFMNNPVLGAGLTYYLAIRIDAGISNPGAYSGVSQLSTTLEFGGTASGGTYDGFGFTMNFREVPAPGAAGLLGVIGLAGARRRRRG